MTQRWGKYHKPQQGVKIKTEYKKYISRILQFALTIFLMMMGMVLLACIAKEIYSMINLVLLQSEKPFSFGVIATLIDYFLYFEFVALIIKYFESDSFFPLQYFICIGITAMLRLVIVNHEDALSTLWYSFAILVQVIALYITKKGNIQ